MDPSRSFIPPIKDFPPDGELHWASSHPEPKICHFSPTSSLTFGFTSNSPNLKIHPITLKRELVRINANDAMQWENN